MIFRSRAAVLTLGLAAQILITLLFLWQVTRAIEADLSAAGEEALLTAGFTWAGLTLNGRDVTVTGLAPSESLREQAAELLADVRGVRLVTNELDLSPLTRDEGPLDAAESLLDRLDRDRQIDALDLPYGLRIEREASLVTLSGMAPDAESRSSLTEIARQKFGANRVIDRLMVADGAPPGYLHAATVVLELAEMIGNGAVGVRENQIFVEAMTDTDSDLRKLRSAVQATLPPDYTASFQVGSRQELASVLRENPELADRIGPLPPPAGRLDGGIDLGRTATPEPAPAPPAAVASEPRFGAEGLAECQSRFDAATSRTKILFGTASTDMSEDSLRLLDELVAIAKSCPEANIEIGGHTDDQGLESNNLDLSQRRAEAVAVYMIRSGIAGGRLIAVGYGENQPLVANRTADDRAVNRRIEFKLSD